MKVRTWGLSAAAILLSAGLVVGGAMWLGQPAPPGSDLVDIVWSESEGSRGPAPEGAPHVVLVIGCTVRQDQTSMYGGPAPTTPFLAGVAERGVRFADPIAAAPWTKAASTALLTGRHPFTVGMTEPGTGRNERVLPERLDTLAERFRDGGWATGAIVLNPNLHSTYGFSQGFDGYAQAAVLWRDVPVKLSGRFAVEALPALLDGLDPDRPRFLEIVLVDAHAPVDVYPGDLAQMPDDGVPEEVQRYRAGLRSLDRMVDWLRQTLEGRGFGARNTVFVFTNDHGEGLSYPVHHGKAHGKHLQPSTVGGVWVMEGPGVAAGHVVEGVASQVDLPQTLLGMVGLPLLDGPGRDLSAQVRGIVSDTGRSVAFADTWFKEVNRAAAYRADTACLLDFALAQRAGAAQCYDRELDPRHLRARVDGALTRRLHRWRREARAAREAFGEAADAAAAPSLEAQLEVLGYVDEEAP